MVDQTIITLTWRAALFPKAPIGGVGNFHLVSLTFSSDQQVVKKVVQRRLIEDWARGYTFKSFFLLNSAEHKTETAHNDKIAQIHFIIAGLDHESL